MNRLFLLSMPSVLLTIFLVSKTQPQSGSAPFVLQDTSKAKPLSITDVREALDSNRQVISEIRQIAGQISREKRASRIAAKSPDTVRHFISINPDTVETFVQVPTRDTSLDHKTWWGRAIETNRRLLKQCKLHRVFKKKKK